MAAREIHERPGAWRVRAADAGLVDAALELARERRVSLASTSAACELAGTQAWYKHDRLRGRTRVRYALRRLVRLDMPRLAEYENLHWLRARVFLAPRPLAAGFQLAGGLPVYQFLITERVPDTETLAEFLARGTDALRAEVLEELAREVARMHALRFVHHDLFRRNLLVQRTGRAGRVWFLDCWAGGPAWNLRGSDYDLEGFLDDTRDVLDAGERARFLALYAEERAAQGRPWKQRRTRTA